MTKAILTDIEGTTSSIAFVKDVLFPYAAENLPDWLIANQRRPEVRSEIDNVANTISRPSSDLDAITQQLLEWIDLDVKATPLKTLQGLLWKSGYENGDYKAHVYEDAVQKLQDWFSSGLKLYVFSSGSIKAQQLFFEFSRYGDMRKLFSGYFDTTTGPKTDSTSYTRIAESMGFDPADVLFLSDISDEIDAAKVAGMNAILVARPEDGTRIPEPGDYDVARNFHEITL